MLESYTQTRQMFDVDQLNAAITAYIGHSYDIGAMHEAPNGTQLSLYIRAQSPEEMDSWDRAYLDDALSGNAKAFGSDAILAAMCSEGLIPEGDFYVDISW